MLRLIFACLLQAGMSQIQNPNPPHPIPLPRGERGRVRGDHLILELGNYLEFGI